MQNLEISLKNVQNFRDCFTHLAEKYKLAIFVEGAPFQETLNDEETRNVMLSGPLDKVIRSVANLYDYEIFSTPRELSQRLIILSKKYTYPWDLPCLSFEEILKTSQDITKLLSNFYVDRRNTNVELAQNVDTTLSFQQKEDLKKGIAVSSLLPDQKKHVWEIVKYTYVGIHSTFQDAQTMMAQRQIRREDNIIVTQKKGVLQERLAIYDRITNEPDQGGNTARHKKNNAKRPPVTFYFTQQTQTIKEIFDQIPPTHMGEIVEIAPSIAHKPCLMYGAIFTTSIPVAIALVRLFDLRNVRLDRKHYRLERKQFPFTTDIEQVAPLLKAMTPLPLHRSIARDTHQDDEVFSAGWRIDEKISQLTREIFRRISLGAETDLKKSQKKILSISETSEFTQKYIAYLYLSTEIADIYSLMLEKDLPDYIKQFNKLVITGESYKKDNQGQSINYYRLRLSLPSVEGSQPIVELNVPQKW
jgi:hypothetical protein